MPYEMRRDDSRFCVYKVPEDGPAERMKCYDRQEAAAAYLTALRIAEGDEDAANKAQYPDGTDIPGELTDNYRPGDEEKNCRTCEYGLDQEDNTILYCGRWQADVRPEWVCDAWEPHGHASEEVMDEMHSLKIIEETPDSATIGGLAVVYGGQDLEGDTFTASTDFMDDHASDHMPVLYDHALGDIKSTLGVVTKIEERDAGLWMEAQIDRAKAYAKEVLELVKSGRLGYSTGSVAHLVQRLEGQIKRWPIYELSLTPTPAEPRTLGVEFLKTLDLLVGQPAGDDIAIKGDEPEIADAIGTDVDASESIITFKLDMENQMSDEIKTTEVAEVAAPVDAPETTPADIKGMVQSAINEIAAERATEAGGILTDEAPAVKRHTKMGGDHTGGDAFTHWCRTGQDNYYTKSQKGSPTKADLAEGSAATGGVLVPQDMYDQIVAKRNESSVPHRAGARIISTSLDSIEVS